MRRNGSPTPNGGSPVPSSYRTAPSAYRSARWSTARPVRPVCSGARYASVPGISLWCVNSGRISAIEAARAKSTSVGVPSAATTTLAGARSRWITSRRCNSARARASRSASPARSPAGSGFGSSARVLPPASASTIEPSRGGSSATCATPVTPRNRSRMAVSCRSRDPASGPSGSFTISVRSARASRVTRVRALSCTIANRTGGSTPSAIPHLRAWVQAPDSCLIFTLAKRRTREMPASPHPRQLASDTPDAMIASPICSAPRSSTRHPGVRSAAPESATGRCIHLASGSRSATRALWFLRPDDVRRWIAGEPGLNGIVAVAGLNRRPTAGETRVSISLVTAVGGAGPDGGEPDGGEPGAGPESGEPDGTVEGPAGLGEWRLRA